MIRTIAIGCGRVFERHHFPAIRATGGMQLVAACEADRTRRAWAEAALGVPTFDDVERALDAVDAQAAIIATPPGSHAAIAAACLDRGRSVFIEKPMALAVSDVHDLITRQARTNAKVQVGFNRRFRSDYVRVRDRLRGGAGLDSLHYTFIAEARRWNPGRSDGADSPAEVLHDAGSHAVDLVAHLGGRRIERVRAHAQRSDRSIAIEVDVELEGGFPSRFTVGRGPLYEERLRVTTNRGTQVVDLSGGSGALRLLRRAELAWRKLAKRPTPTDESFRAQLAAFVAACHDRPDPRAADANAGLESVAAIAACIASLEAGGEWRPVRATLSEGRLP